MRARTSAQRNRPKALAQPKRVVTAPPARAVSRRERLLASAARLFRHYGTQKTTMAEIAREAGIGTGSLYLEFASKAAIVAELARRDQAAVVGAMAHACSRDHIAFAQRLRSLLVTRVMRVFAMAKEGAHGCDLLQGCFQPGTQTTKAPPLANPRRALRVPDTLIAKQRAEEARIFSALFREGNARGECSVSDPDATAELIQHTLTFLAPPHVFELGEDEAAALALSLADFFLQGLRAKPDR